MTFFYLVLLLNTLAALSAAQEDPVEYGVDVVSLSTTLWRAPMRTIGVLSDLDAVHRHTTSLTLDFGNALPRSPFRFTTRPYLQIIRGFPTISMMLWKYQMLSETCHCRCSEIASRSTETT